MQTEKAKSSHFDRTRGDKNQIFPTLVNTKDDAVVTHAFVLIGHSGYSKRPSNINFEYLISFE